MGVSGLSGLRAIREPWIVADNLTLMGFRQPFKGTP
jgi:hypothetical protein